MHAIGHVRCSYVATIKRADDLKLGDQIVMSDLLDRDKPEIVGVWELTLLGEDVTINGAIETSRGNTYIVLSKKEG